MTDYAYDPELAGIVPLLPTVADWSDMAAARAQMAEMIASMAPADGAARVLSGSSWMGLRDREAYVTRGVRLTPMFTGLAALAALLFLITFAWWREGR